MQNRGEVPSDNIRNEISLVKGEVMDRMLSKGMEIIKKNKKWFEKTVEALKKNHIMSKEEILALRDECI